MQTDILERHVVTTGRRKGKILKAGRMAPNAGSFNIPVELGTICRIESGDSGMKLIGHKCPRHLPIKTIN